MFILDGKPLSPDRAFTTSDGTQYPANWLRLATPAQRAAIGITEQPAAPVYDQRFYWGYDNDGKLIPKDHTQLVDQWTAQVKATAGTLLTPTDWYIVRAGETGLEAPQSVVDRRASIRYLSNYKETFLRSTTSTEELAAYVAGPDFGVWEEVTIKTKRDQSTEKQ